MRRWTRVAAEDRNILHIKGPGRTASRVLSLPFLKSGCVGGKNNPIEIFGPGFEIPHWVEVAVRWGRGLMSAASDRETVKAARRYNWVEFFIVRYVMGVVYLGLSWPSRRETAGTGIKTRARRREGRGYKYHLAKQVGVRDARRVHVFCASFWSKPCEL